MNPGRLLPTDKSGVTDIHSRSVFEFGPGLLGSSVALSAAGQNMTEPGCARIYITSSCGNTSSCVRIRITTNQNVCPPKSRCSPTTQHRGESLSNMVSSHCSMSESKFRNGLKTLIQPRYHTTV